MNKNDYLVVCRKHWFVFVWPGVIALFCILIGIGAGEISTAIIFIVIAVLVIARPIIIYHTDYIAVTPTKVVAHKGLIRSTRLSAPISKIQNVGIGNGLFGKIFRYHTITIDNAGTGKTEFVFRNATNALELERVIEELQLQG